VHKKTSKQDKDNCEQADNKSIGHE